MASTSNIAITTMSKIKKEGTKKSVELSQRDLIPVLPLMSPRTLKRSMSRSSYRSDCTCTKSADKEPSHRSPLRKRQRTGGIVKKRTKTKISIHFLDQDFSAGQCDALPLDQKQSVETKSTSSTIPTDLRIGEDCTDSTEEAYPVPKTAQQREKAQLARQKQLEEMKSREAAEARQERLLRRRGMWKSPVKIESKRKITWKTELTDIFNYSQVT